MQLYGFNYCYLALFILFDIHHLFAYSEVVKSIARVISVKNTNYCTRFIYVHTVKWFQVLLCIINNSIKHQSFIYT